MSAIEPRNDRSLYRKKFVISKLFIESVSLSIYDCIKPLRKKLVIELVVFVGTL
jgi:hypothetical protein